MATTLPRVTTLEVPVNNQIMLVTEATTWTPDDSGGGQAVTNYSYGNARMQIRAEVVPGTMPAYRNVSTSIILPRQITAAYASELSAVLLAAQPMLLAYEAFAVKE